MAVGTNNRITTSGFSYDAAGNVAGDGVNAYTWNAESETKTAAGVTYTYDGDGHRVEKSNGTLYWYGMGSEVLDETDLSGNLKNEYVFFGGKRIAVRSASGSINYYVEDHLGSSRVMTSSAGAVCYDADFLPYGQEVDYTSTCGSNYKFTGKERDPESNLDNFGARYFTSQMGRFMSPDWSAKVEPVPYAKLLVPQTLNLYSYVGNNPVSWVDRDGHYACQGSKEQCQTFKDALGALQKADSGLKKGSFERKRLDKVLKFYGTDNGKGPAIKFADLSKEGAVGETITEHGKTTITLDPTALSHYGEAGQGETVAHEGTHGIDQHTKGVGAGLFWVAYDTEYHAYQSESYVDMGLNKPNETDWKPVWAPGMSYNQHVLNMTRDAYQNAVADCQGVEGCVP